jgi:hypothetical protein
MKRAHIFILSTPQQIPRHLLRQLWHLEALWQPILGLPWHQQIPQH